MLQYLIKFSISLAVLYIFYRAVLRPLTFYQWNRFYLLGYSLLSLLIPFIDISDWMGKSAVEDNRYISIIPPVSRYTFITEKQQPSFFQQLTPANWILLVFIAGALVMLLRVLLQYISLRRLRANSRLLTGHHHVQLFETSENITPFSFGNAIYINPARHTEEELQRIIQHEFVHVRQKHSIDLLTGELLCIINWFNPFAWFIRHAIRQNLEFIADHLVLQNGIAKKEYQYLLLKVIGAPQYALASHFNFSNLKKRIAMMNKMKSAQLHLTKFLFVLPLLGVLLLAFRGKAYDAAKTSSLIFTGVIYDTETLLPLSGATVNEKYADHTAVTDANGYFKMEIPLNPDSVIKISYDVLMNGFGKSAPRSMGIEITGGKTYSNLVFIGLDKWAKGHFDILTAEHQQFSGNKCYQFNAAPDYEFVQQQFKEFKYQVKLANNLAEQIGASKKPIWMLEGKPFIFLKDGTQGGACFFDKEELKASSEFIVWVDGKLMSIEEANAMVNRTELYAIGTCRAENAIHEYGVNKNVIVLYWKTKFNNFTQVKDTIPVSSPVPANSTINKKGYLLTIADNNGECVVLVKDQQGKIIKAVTLEEWNRNKKENEIRYGSIPPPPIAPVAPVAPVKNLPAIAPVAPVLPNTIVGLRTQPQVITGGLVSLKELNILYPPLYIVDGKEMEEGYNINSLKQEDINSVSVWKDEKTISKYGEKAKYGVVEISTRHKTRLPEGILIILDGKEMPAGSDPDDYTKEDAIESMNVLKGKSATDKYGQKGEKGVIELTSRKKDDDLLKDVLLIIDGRELPAGSRLSDYVNTADIESMNVLRYNMATIKYGEKAKKGAIEIKTKSAVKPAVKNEIINMIADTIVISKQHVKITGGNMVMDENKSIAIINGSFHFDTRADLPYVVFNGQEVKDIPSFTITKAKFSMRSLDPKQGIAKYGSKAAFGALEINSL